MAKKYRLIKDLPTHPAGTEATMGDDGILVLLPIRSSVRTTLSKTTLEAFPNILTEWFEPVEPKRWRASNNQPWFYMSLFGGVKSNLTAASNRSEKLYQHGNMFRSEATAAVVGRAQKLFFEWLHDKDASVIALGRDDQTRELSDSMDRARAAVLEGDRNA